MLLSRNDCICKICYRRWVMPSTHFVFKSLECNNFSDNLAEKQKMRAPSTIAGLVRYEEEGESLINLKPKHVVGIVVALIILELFLFLLVPL